jgi:polyphosphate kinase
MQETVQSYPYIHRDLSWLSFNYRVLQEARDSRNPLLERIKFMAIFSNNLNEFYRVRVAHHRNLLRVGKKTKKELEFPPKTILKNINKIVNRQQEEFTEIFENLLVPELEQQNIFFIQAESLSEEQKVFVDDYFDQNLLPFVQPVLLNAKKIKPFLNNAALYLALVLEDKEKNHIIDYALVNIPSDQTDRFIELPSVSGSHEIIILDEIVRHSIVDLFPGYNILGSYSIKFTRDAELYIDDEFSGNLIQKIKSSLSKRKVGPATRTVYDRDMPAELLDYLINIFDIEKIDLHPEGRYHNNFDFFQFPHFGKAELMNSELSPLPCEISEANIFQSLDHKDQLFYYPYHSYDCVIQFFKEAIEDPNVTHIKITQYRVAKKSEIMDTLIKGVKKGKQITVFIEVKARFDEEANLRWGEKLEKAGIKVIYSFPGLKVHCKLALIIKNVDGENKFYSYLSTGNFNEKTAEIYCDYGFFTSDIRITREVSRIFSFLETVVLPDIEFEHLFVGQFNLREKINEKIDREIENAQAGKEAYLLMKLNSLEDKEMVIKIYQAAQAGVKVDLIVRGICCVVPNIEGISMNIRAISIVDRYLEHARVYVFHNEGNREIYLSSADLMTRNLSYRIEVAFPIYDQALSDEIYKILEYQLKDNVKGRIIDEQQSNSYVETNVDMPFQSQIETYFYYKRKYKS